LIAFIFLYITGITRAIFAKNIGKRVAKALGIKYITPYGSKDTLDDYQRSKLTKTQKLGTLIVNIVKYIVNLLIWCVNFMIWMFKETQTKQELKTFFNKVVNSYLSFISIFYIRIMTTSSQIFVCTYQPDGSWTLNKSSDLFCFQGIWWAMLPISAITFIIFGIGAFFYFGIIIVFYQKLNNSIAFMQMNKFTMQKFKKKTFFW
jgi:hypothetical protein